MARPVRTRAARLGAVLAVLAAGSSTLLTQPADAASTSGPKSQAVCAKPAAGHMACLSWRRTDVKARKANAIAPMATPGGWSPADLKSAYNIPTNLGAGTTVAIVDAYDDPNAEADLAVYRSQFGLPACTTANGCFRKVSQTGSTTALPKADAGWAGEIALDIQMVSAACPLCKILLVEATSSSTTNLGAAENYAASQPGVKAISNSWGGPESSSDASANNAYMNHPGIAITASTGDNGYGTSWPATAASVIAVGGTSLSKASNTRGWSESAWSGAGSGCSTYVAKPVYQVDTGCAKRSIADVSAVADPNTGVAVYDSYGSGGWAIYGGTSVSSPIVGTLYAMANNPAPSASYAYLTANLSGLNDVVSGSNGSCSVAYLCKAGTGYDGPTGMGTPNGLLALGGVGSGGGTVSNKFSVAVSPSSGSLTAGSSSTATVNTATTSGSAQSVALTASGAPAGVSVSFSPASVTSGGSSTMTITSTSAVTPGTYTISVNGTGSSSSASGTYALTVSAPTGGGGSTCTPQQVLKNQGFESASTNWTATSGVIGKVTGTHSGSYDAWFDGYGTTHTDSAAQTVTVPAGCTKATVSFWLKTSTAETTTTLANDTFKVTLGGTTLATYSNLTRYGSWTQVTLNATLPAGTTSTTLKFTGAENSSRQTSFFVDDTALTVS